MLSAFLPISNKHAVATVVALAFSRPQASLDKPGD
jgi:hypothetical protein